MNEQDLKQYVDSRIEEHDHRGGANNSRQVSFNDLRDLPNFVYNPMTEDLSLGGYKITGPTLITGQTEITSLEATDEFLVSDASDSGNLKKIERQYFGDYSVSASTNTIYTSANDITTLDLTVLFSGVINVIVDPTDGASNSFFNLYYYLPGEDISSAGTQVVTTSGASARWATAPNVNNPVTYEVLVYAGTRLKAVISGKTMQVTVKYDKTLRTAPYAN